MHRPDVCWSTSACPGSTGWRWPRRLERADPGTGRGPDHVRPRRATSTAPCGPERAASSSRTPRHPAGDRDPGRRRGDALLAPSVTRRLVEELGRRQPPAALRASRADRPRARSATLMAEGCSNAEIGDAVHLRGHGQDPRGQDPGQARRARPGAGRRRRLPGTLGQPIGATRAFPWSRSAGSYFALSSTRRPNLAAPYAAATGSSRRTPTSRSRTTRPARVGAQRVGDRADPGPLGREHLGGGADPDDERPVPRRATAAEGRGVLGGCAVGAVEAVEEDDRERGDLLGEVLDEGVDDAVRELLDVTALVVAEEAPGVRLVQPSGARRTASARRSRRAVGRRTGPGRDRSCSWGEPKPTTTCVAGLELVLLGDERRRRRVRPPTTTLTSGGNESITSLAWRRAAAPWSRPQKRKPKCTIGPASCSGTRTP